MTSEQMIEKLEKIEYEYDKMDEIYSIAKELFDKATREADKKSLYISDYFLAKYHNFEGSFKKALMFVNACIVEARTLHDEVYVLKGLTLKGSVDTDLMDPYDATESLLSAIAYSRKAKNVRYIALTHNLVGHIFHSLNDLDNAFSYFEEAKNDITISEAEPDTLYMKMLLDYTYICISMKKFDKAIKAINTAFLTFDGDILNPFVALRELYDCLISETEDKKIILERIYHLLLTIDENTSGEIRVRILFTLKNIIKSLNDESLDMNYLGLIDEYVLGINKSRVQTEAYLIRSYLGYQTDDSSDTIYQYANSLSKDYKLLMDSMARGVKKLVDLNRVVIERDNVLENNKQLQKLSSTDELTKLYNRRNTESTIIEILNDVTKSSYAFLLIDIDKFKDINDTYGHTTGDQALIFLANTLRKHFSDNAIIGRLGGDEFVVMIYNLPSQYDIRKNMVKYMVENLQTYLREAKLNFLEDNHLSISIGVTLENADFDVLYSNADVALYDSKYSGRDKYSIYPNQSKVNN